MKITRRQLRSLIFESINETSDARKRAMEKLKRLKQQRAQRDGIIAAADQIADQERASAGPGLMGSTSSGLETGYSVTLKNGQKAILPATEIGFQEAGYSSYDDLLPYVGATYDPGQNRSGIVFNSRIDALRYYSEMSKMKRAQSALQGIEAIDKQMKKKKRFFGLFEGSKISRFQLRYLIKEELKILSESKEQKEVKMRDIEKAVRKCLEKEGGAAGMGLLVKCVKALETKTKKLPKSCKTNKQIAKCILKMDFVVKHRYDDIILTIGLPKRK